MEKIKIKEWNTDRIISNLTDEEWFNTTALCGLTYGEIQELNDYMNELDWRNL